MTLEAGGRSAKGSLAIALFSGVEFLWRGKLEEFDGNLMPVFSSARERDVAALILDSGVRSSVEEMGKHHATTVERSNVKGCVAIELRTQATGSDGSVKQRTFGVAIAETQAGYAFSQG